MSSNRKPIVGDNPKQEEIKYSKDGYKPKKTNDPLKANAKTNKQQK